MDFAMTDEQELLLESVREFCDRYFTCLLYTSRCV